VVCIRTVRGHHVRIKSRGVLFSVFFLLDSYLTTFFYVLKGYYLTS